MLGLSLQYMRDGEIKVRTVGRIELTKAHTAQNIKDEILARLREFGIKPNQIVSITSDNASNMISMIKLLNREIEDEKPMSNNLSRKTSAMIPRKKKTTNENDLLLHKNDDIYSDE